MWLPTMAFAQKADLFLIGTFVELSSDRWTIIQHTLRLVPKCALDIYIAIGKESIEVNKKRGHFQEYGH